MNLLEKKDAVRTAKVFRAARKQKGFSQLELSKKLSITQGTLSKIELGKLSVSSSIWYEFCNLTDLQPEWAWGLGVVDRPEMKNKITSDQVGSFSLPEKYRLNRGTPVRSIRALLGYFSSVYGEKKLNEYMERIGVDPDYFLVLSNQININFSLDTFEVLAADGRLKPENLKMIANAYSNPTFHGALAGRFHTTGPEVHENLLTDLIRNVGHYDMNFNYVIESVQNGVVTISIAPSEHLKAFNYKRGELGAALCSYKQEILKSFVTLGSGSSGVSPLAIEERECHYKGAPRCLFHVRILN